MTVEGNNARHERPADAVIALPAAGAHANNASGGASRKSNQMRALVRKTLSYQKRQTLVNVCCVAIFPLLVVAAVGSISLLSTTVPLGKDFQSPARYCSNSDAYMNNTLNIPIKVDLYWMVGDVNATDVNYYQLSRYGDEEPCVTQFDNEYAFSEPYNRDPGSPLSRDSTFLPQPRRGWFDDEYSKAPLYFKPYGGDILKEAVEKTHEENKAPYDYVSPNYTLYNKIFPVQLLPWTYVYAADGVQDLGIKGRHGPYASQGAIPAPDDEPAKSGFLGGTSTRYFKYGNYTSPQKLYVPTDFYVRGDPSQQPDEFLLAELTRISDTYEDVYQKQVKYFLNRTAENPVPSRDEALYLESEEMLTTKYPFYGVLYIDKLDTAALAIKATVQCGRAVRLNRAISTLGYAPLLHYRVKRNIAVPPQGFRAAYEISQLSNALLAASPNASTYRIVRSARAMPQTIAWDRREYAPSPAAVTAKIAFPFGLTFLLPMFVLALVKEKEDRILIMMRMHGLSTWAYYLTHYLHFVLLQLVCSVVFVASGAAWGIKMFLLTDPLVYLLLLLLWANVLVLMAFMLSVLFSRSRVAQKVTYAIVILSCVLNSTEEIIFGYEEPPTAIFAWPFFAFYHALGVLGYAADDPFRQPYKFADLTGSDTVRTCMLFLLVQWLCLLALTAYAANIVRTEFGVPKPWHFVVSQPFNWILKTARNSSRAALSDPERECLMAEQDEALDQEDDDVRAERERIEAMKLSPRDFHNSPLIVKNIRKVFAGGKVANHSMCLGVDRNTVFGLLGPNGAGKSTLIHMMVGLYPPTGGTAYIAGHDVVTDTDNVYLNIGVCPQHDILWDDLTVEEHLLFYARLRGVRPHEEVSAVCAALEKVELSALKSSRSKTLSGGEKRRLSIAISLLGDAPLVFMDEPTTGLDPEVRRAIWNIIHGAKQDKTIILTTHSMEEADELCSRVGIMAKGVLRCVGSPLHLKRKYGSGFRLQIAFAPQRNSTVDTSMDHSGINAARQRVMRTIEAMLPPNRWRVVDQGHASGSVIYEFDVDRNGGARNTVSQLLGQMEALKAETSVCNWAFSQSSLEDVFLNIVSADDADATQ